MSGLREDLIAAKARLGLGTSAHASCHAVASSGEGKRGPRYNAMFNALVAENNDEITNLLSIIYTPEHGADIEAIFDRAIAKAEGGAS